MNGRGNHPMLRTMLYGPFFSALPLFWVWNGDPSSLAQSVGADRCRHSYSSRSFKLRDPMPYD
ncbi:hypothetical protein J3F84DRAFT_357969 [Trichoderma pleuroticola]